MNVKVLIVLSTFFAFQRESQASPVVAEDGEVFTKVEAENLDVYMSTIVEELISNNQIGFTPLTPIGAVKLSYGRQPRRIVLKRRKCKGKCRKNRKSRKNNNKLVANNYYDLKRAITPEREIVDHSRKMGRLRFWNS